ncbi:hypothetical protein CCUS01_07471 [Colletotrichum cuscutae]|uniref:Uncharacterized protein n=1 Tax=Colletotrichum cuscutae TaxID=1209917 RepID=A0AAI9Y0E5_9PEZI|nr:hypothetical protein CCUS01_07471 [Colletotrichum cuscutae]
MYTNLSILEEAQKTVTPEKVEQVADELTTEEQKEKVFEGIHCIAAADTDTCSFVFETLVDMYLMSYKLNKDQKKAIESLRGSASEEKGRILMGVRGHCFLYLGLHVRYFFKWRVEVMIHLGTYLSKAGSTHINKCTSKTFPKIEIENFFDLQSLSLGTPAPYCNASLGPRIILPRLITSRSFLASFSYAMAAPTAAFLASTDMSLPLTLYQNFKGAFIVVANYHPAKTKHQIASTNRRRRLILLPSFTTYTDLREANKKLPPYPGKTDAALTLECLTVIYLHDETATSSRHRVPILEAESNKHDLN